MFSNSEYKIIAPKCYSYYKAFPSATKTHQILTITYTQKRKIASSHCSLKNIPLFILIFFSLTFRDSFF